MENKRYFYITPEDFEKAKENGIHKETVITRVRKLGWDVDKAITKPARKKRKFTKEEIEIMEENGIDRNTAVCRLNYGWTVEEAISRMKGIPCGTRSTSCPDQLAIALEQALQAEKRGEV